MRTRTISLVLFILLLAISSWWVLNRLSANFGTELESKPTWPDSFMKQVVYQHFGSQGKVTSFMFSPKVVHYPLKNKTSFSYPNIIIHDKSKHIWHITAEQGESLHGDKVIHLWKNVLVKRQNKDQQQPMTLATPTLTYHPRTHIAETKAAVKITRPNSVITAIGMRANLESGNMKLLSKAKGSYVPPHKP